METQMVGMVSITKNDKLIAVIYHDTKKRSQIFYKCEEMGAEEIKELFDHAKDSSIFEETIREQSLLQDML